MLVLHVQTIKLRGSGVFTNLLLLIKLEVQSIKLLKDQWTVQNFIQIVCKCHNKEVWLKLWPYEYFQKNNIVQWLKNIIIIIIIIWIRIIIIIIITIIIIVIITNIIKSSSSRYSMKMIFKANSKVFINYNDILFILNYYILSEILKYICCAFFFLIANTKLYFTDMYCVIVLAEGHHYKAMSCSYCKTPQRVAVWPQT